MTWTSSGPGAVSAAVAAWPPGAAPAGVDPAGEDPPCGIAVGCTAASPPASGPGPSWAPAEPSSAHPAVAGTAVARCSTHHQRPPRTPSTRTTTRTIPPTARAPTPIWAM
ncbi:hypothetical protein BJF86_09405 [Serinicoccus sp. CNJ-927]|nr:hypothetical protein BJF86_09405 [Serinicoccus sp. CNJ-927]